MSDATTSTPIPNPFPPVTATGAHLYVLLDRSGSMSTMASDVIGGFNRLLKDQQAAGGDARMTLVQFDSEDPQEVVADAVPIAEVVSLTPATFVPRGGTPLLDATGRLLGRAAGHEAQRRVLGEPAEAILFVTITDGEENQSREFDLTTIRRAIERRKAEGWTFAFLGAGLDAYAEAGGLGYAASATQSFAADGRGADLAFKSLSHATTALRQRARVMPAAAAAAAPFFESKEAEEDRARRA